MRVLLQNMCLEDETTTGRSAVCLLIPRREYQCEWEPTMAEETVAATAAIQSPILLRAPNGAEVWTIIELQGSIESKASNSLNGVEFAQLSWEPNTVSHARAHRPRRSTACTLAPARRRPHLSLSSGSRRQQALGRTSRSRSSSSIRSRATHATMRVRPSLRAEPASRMIVPTRLTTVAPTAPPSRPLRSSRCREAKARLQGAA